MNITKIAFVSASWLVAGFTAFSVPSFAADSPVKKPAASQQIAKPGDDGMMCEHMGGKMCDHKDGKMCDHKDGMMGGQMGGMGGHGEGMKRGAARMHMVMSLDLSDEQRSRINKLSDELIHDNWATKGLIMDGSAKLRDLYAADKRDPAAIGKEYQKIFDLQRQMIEATITAQNRIEELLTPDQRAQLKKMHSKKMSMHDHPMH